MPGRWTPLHPVRQTGDPAKRRRDQGAKRHHAAAGEERVDPAKDGSVLPRSVKGAVVFLASSAASLITGDTILIDGGWTSR